MKYAITMLLVGCTFAAMFICCASARAGPYELEIIVQAGDVIDGRTVLSPFSSNPNNISINNDGEVAFLGRVDHQGRKGWGVMTQRRFIAGAGKLVDGFFAGIGGAATDGEVEDYPLTINPPVLEVQRPDAWESMSGAMPPGFSSGGGEGITFPPYPLHS